MNDEIRAAQQAITDAENDLENLRQRVVEGDTTITATQLAERQGAIDFAQLQLQAAQRRQVIAVEQDREAQADAFRAEVDAFIAEGDAQLVEPFLAAIRAVETAVNALRAQRSRLEELQAANARVQSLYPTVRGQDGIDRHPVVRGVSTNHARGLLVRDNGQPRVHVTSANPREAAFTIVAAVLTREEMSGSGWEIGSPAPDVVETMPSLMGRIDEAKTHPAMTASRLMASPDRTGLLMAVRAVALAEDPDDGPADEQP
jgi:hypothetical protein